MDSQVLNALTIDVEDWYQVANLEHLISFDDWQKCEDRLSIPIDRLLNMFREFDVRATFFVLGWNAERHPELVKRIADEGHELGTHGYSHRLVYKQTPREFSNELRRSIDAIANASGAPVRGHRAASFSITSRSLWAIDVLADQGIDYDTSIFPVKHSRYGLPESPRKPYFVKGSGASIVEYPLSTVRILGKNVPFSGGAYFRFLPYPLVRASFQALNRDGIPVMFYLHPWELDPGQPRMNLNPKLRLRCYYNIRKVESRLAQLLTDFRFGPVADVLSSLRREKLATVEAAR